MTPKNSDRIIRALQHVGVQRLFGMPGGGSSSDLIEAAGNVGLPFSLAHTETAAAFMATAQAEITGKSGACLTTLGPGAAALMNGVANAYLDRVPLIALTDCLTEAVSAVMQHQALPQGEMFSPVVKWSRRLHPDKTDEELQEAIAAVTSLPPGPIHLDISSAVTSAAGKPEPFRELASSSSRPVPIGPVPVDVQQILQQARRPVFLIGLGARTKAISAAIREFCGRIGIPALVTYKAKGVVPDNHPWFGGVLTNGALERDVLERADAFVSIGLDPVELLPRPWKLSQPVISITAWPMNQRQVPLASELVGDVVSWLRAISAFFPARTDWKADEIVHLVETQRERMRPNGGPGKLLPHRVVELVAQVYQGARATVDAGAFMFPVMALWPVAEPCDLLISNGLATMGFALPAAIGVALLDTSKPTVAFTGDGGLLMCLGELRTAAREGLRLRIIVFDDGALSLIKIKQIQQGYRPDGVSIGDIDWKALGTSFGVTSHQVESEAALSDCLEKSVHYPGPVLIAAKITPETYPPTIRALRG